MVETDPEKGGELSYPLERFKLETANPSTVPVKLSAKEAPGADDSGEPSSE
jgi:hypothetical protein